VKYSFVAQTDKGRVRDNNEDAVAFDEATRLCVLADGMGGYNAGEVASGMATDLILADMSRWLAESAQNVAASNIRSAIDDAIDRSNQAIFEAAHVNPDWSGMGTTLVVGVFHANRLILGHIGDSRCYCLRRGRLRQLTKDHTLLQEQLDAGLLTPRQAQISMHRNLLTRALGVETRMYAELNEYEVLPGDVYMLCSDGLTDMVGGAEIAKLMGLKIPLPHRAKRLIQAANAHGGRDNITVLLAKVEATEGESGLVTRWWKKLKYFHHNN
jgi:PPM family protein phosphatase